MINERLVYYYEALAVDVQFAGTLQGCPSQMLPLPTPQCTEFSITNLSPIILQLKGSDVGMASRAASVILAANLHAGTPPHGEQLKVSQCLLKFPGLSHQMSGLVGLRAQVPGRLCVPFPSTLTTLADTFRPSNPYSATAGCG